MITSLQVYICHTNKIKHKNVTVMNFMHVYRYICNQYYEHVSARFNIHMREIGHEAVWSLSTAKQVMVLNN